MGICFGRIWEIENMQQGYKRWRYLREQKQSIVNLNISNKLMKYKKNQMDLNCKVLEDNQRYKIVSFE